MPGFRTVAIIGPPNVGKSTVFNRLTGLRQKVGNYSGVTVEQHEGLIKGTRTRLLDLPGVWSMEGDESDLISEDQCIAVRALRGEIEGQPQSRGRPSHPRCHPASPPDDAGPPGHRAQTAHAWSWSI